MFIALDENGNRISAENATKGNHYFCQYCNEILEKREGEIRKHCFAHKPNTKCYYSRYFDEETEHGKSDWHINMQEKFPKESREYRFTNADGKVEYIADVFLDDKNLVIEFQHSSITPKEMWERTKYHLDSGRKVVWVFDERKDSKTTRFGKFKIKNKVFSKKSKYWNGNENTLIWLAHWNYCQHFSDEFVDKWDNKNLICLASVGDMNREEILQILKKENSDAFVSIGEYWFQVYYWNNMSLCTISIEDIINKYNGNLFMLLCKEYDIYPKELEELSKYEIRNII